MGANDDRASAADPAGGQRVRGATEAEVRRALRYVPDVARLMRYARSGVSLDEPATAGEERPLRELLADATAEGPLRRAIRDELTSRLKLRVRELDERQRDVLRKRFGLEGERPRTLRQAARELGVSRERVRQIEVRALLELRNLLAASPKDDPLQASAE